ncbi:MAG: hypothetical protein H8M99_13100 [Gloeobacteraceae cyanobacterium ES-bin-144]|nr:hypothetical protein [Verrucomicrobiales bacterium]
MGLDLRLPIGLYFTILGLLLGGYGIFTNGSKIYQRSLDMNINIIWGVVLLVFGIAMLVPSLIDRKKNAGK